MPYIVKDFDKRLTSEKMHLTIKPFGWIHDKEDDGVPIEFGYIFLNNYDPEPSMCMRVVGTEHVWAWFQTSFNQLSKGNYADLFTKQLEEFRIEFLLWIKNPNTAGLEWVREYYEIFKGYFYDFSKEEQEEYDRAKQQWDKDQRELDTATERIRKEKANNMSNQQY